MARRFSRMAMWSPPGIVDFDNQATDSIGLRSGLPFIEICRVLPPLAAGSPVTARCGVVAREPGSIRLALRTSER